MGSFATLPDSGAAPSASRASYRVRTRYITLAIPLTKKIPNPMIAVVTWMASQYDRSAATSGPASA